MYYSSGWWLIALLALAACTPTTGKPHLTGDAEAQGIADTPGNPAGGLSIFDTLRIPTKMGVQR